MLEPSSSALLRKLSTKQGQGRAPKQDTWNLLVFSRPSQYGYDRHPDFDDTDTVTRVKAKQLAFDFQTVEQRVRFENAFREISDDNQRQQAGITNFMNRAVRLEDKPKVARTNLSHRNSNATQRGSIVSQTSEPEDIRQIHRASSSLQRDSSLPHINVSPAFPSEADHFTKGLYVN